MSPHSKRMSLPSVPLGRACDRKRLWGAGTLDSFHSWALLSSYIFPLPSSSGPVPLLPLPHGVALTPAPALLLQPFASEWFPGAQRAYNWVAGTYAT